MIQKYDALCMHTIRVCLRVGVHTRMHALNTYRNRIHVYTRAHAHIYAHIYPDGSSPTNTCTIRSCINYCIHTYMYINTLHLFVSQMARNCPDTHKHMHTSMNSNTTIYTRIHIHKHTAPVRLPTGQKLPLRQKLATIPTAANTDVSSVDHIQGTCDTFLRVATSAKSSYKQYGWRAWYM
jgi:hypothetical protein